MQVSLFEAAIFSSWCMKGPFSNVSIEKAFAVETTDQIGHIPTPRIGGEGKGDSRGVIITNGF